MTTNVTGNMRGLASDLENIPDLPSAVNSGIKGDEAHAREGGYHISIEDQPADNYSVVRPDDKAPPGSWPRDQASAIDTSMSTPDMVRAWDRVYAVWADHSDPRRKYFNAFNGWNGKGDAERLDFYANTRKVASADHKWHCHDENGRKYVNDPEMRRAKRSVYAGETVQQYLTGTGGDSEMGGRLVVLQDALGKYWACDGILRYEVDKGTADSLVSPSQAGAYLGTYPSILRFGTSPEGMGSWGRDVATLGGDVTLSAQQVVDLLKTDPEFRAMIIACVNEAEDS